MSRHAALSVTRPVTRGVTWPVGVNPDDAANDWDFDVHFTDKGAGEVNILPMVGAVAGTFTRATTAMTFARVTPYVNLPGTPNSAVTTPDSVAISQTGDQDVRIKVALADWVGTGVFLWNRMASGTDRGLRLGVQASGFLRVEWSVDGTVGTLVTKDSTAAPSVSDGDTIWLRWVLDVDNGAGGNDVKFYTSADGVIWTQLGATVTTAGVTAVFDPVGSAVLGDQAAGNKQKIFHAEFRDGIDGEVVARFNPGTAAWGATSWTSDTGEVWTLNGTARLVQGEIVSVASGVPRSYYDPSTGEYLGYLAEGARTNFAIQSIFPGTGATPTSWSQPTATGTSAETPSRFGSGDGSQAWVQSASAERPYLAQNTGGLSDGITYCFSIFLEATSGVAAQNLILVSSGTATPTVSFPICEANPSGGPAGVTVAGRLFVTFTIAAAGTVQIRCGVGTAGNSTGSATFSRPQLEAGAFPSTFIPTTTASVTRNADVLTYPTTGWHNESEGTIYFEGTTPSATGGVLNRYLAINDGTTNNRGLMYFSAGRTPSFLVTDAGVAQAILTGAVQTWPQSIKTILAYKVDDFAAYINGVASGTDSSGTTPTGLTTLSIGVDLTSASEPFFGPIRRVAYSRKRKINGVLQALTGA